MLSRARSGHPVELQDLTARFTLDSASEFLFGSCVHSLASPLPFPGEITADGARVIGKDGKLSKADEFVRAFNEAQVVIASRVWVGGVWPLYEFWKDLTVCASYPLDSTHADAAACRKPMKVIDAFIDPILAQALSKKQERTALAEVDAESQAATLLDHLVMHTDGKYTHDAIACAQRSRG